EGARVAGLLDQVALAEGGEDEDGGPALARDLPGSSQAVHTRHLDVEDGQVGVEVADQLHGLVAAPGLAHDLVTLFLEDLLEVEADDRLVFGHDDADGNRVAPLVGQRVSASRRRACRAARPGLVPALRSRQPRLLAGVPWHR